MTFAFSVAWAVLLARHVAMVSSWDPDAGVVSSWTRSPGAVVHVTSNPAEAANIVDGQEKTHWQSGACMPQGFLKRDDLNTLLGVCANQPNRCIASGNPDTARATDGSFYTSVAVETVHEEAYFEIQMKSPKPLHKVAARGVYPADTKMWALGSDGWRMLRVFNSSDNYKFLVAAVDECESVEALKLNSTQKFRVAELAVMDQPCFEMTVVDLGTIREVNVIKTRHYSREAVNTSLLTSINGQDWTVHAHLKPTVQKAVVTRLPRAVMVKFVAVRHKVKEGNYKKVYVWELEAWDQFGQWGPPPLPRRQDHSLEELLGVNGIWGWGVSTYSDVVPPGLGPELYTKIGTYGRNYHNMIWDVKDPDNVPDYAKMAQGGGTEVHSWLNWDREYGAWVKAGLSVHASIQFLMYSFPPSVWDNPRIAGEGYGRAFANHFGPSEGNGLVSAVEIGNEPWKYEANFYREVLQGMAQGAKSADPNMTVLPCALQAHDPHVESPTFGNYIGARLNQSAAAYVDVLNFHMYSFVVTQDGRRVAVHPEHENSEFNSIRNMLRWRDVNTPGKPVWVTEWGWDSDGASESCDFSECVSEHAQAIYGVRGFMILARTGVERATWFFYGNSANCASLFCRSGLTGSKKVDFAEKKVYRAFRAIRLLMGGTYFLEIVQEDQHAFVYLFGNKTGSPTHLVAWRPVLDEDAAFKCASFDLGAAASPKAAWRVSGDSSVGEQAPKPGVQQNSWTMLVSTVPTVVELQH